MNDPLSATPLTYNDYAAWHYLAEKRFLEPARLAGVRLLAELLDAGVPEIDRARFRISASRVKSPQRAFTKLSTDKYRARFTTYDRVPDLVDDLVGIRLICNNLSDINTFQEVIDELPKEDSNSGSLAIEAGSQRDYFTEPKASGYRAFHVNLVVPVPQPRGMKRLRVEVQVRTLLQDGWGELTHEDTYKPGSRVPDWIVVMSLRMAELLAAVDAIAQDLRTGLDVETQKQVESEAPEEGPYVVPRASSTDTTLPDQRTVDLDPPASGENDEITTAMLREARRQVEAIHRPTPLAVVSQDLTAKFGNDIARTWAGYGAFRKFLVGAVPEVVITGPSPGYIHPLNDAPPPDWETDWGSANLAEGLPNFVRALRTYDKGIPLLSSARIDQLALAVDEALKGSTISKSETGQISRVQIEAIAKAARDVGEERGHLVIRPHAVYLLQMLSRYELLIPSMASDEIKQVLQFSLLASAERNNVIDDRDAARQELSEWLRLEPSE